MIDYREPGGGAELSQGEGAWPHWPPLRTATATVPEREFPG